MKKQNIQHINKHPDEESKPTERTYVGKSKIKTAENWKNSPKLLLKSKMKVPNDEYDSKSIIQSVSVWKNFVTRNSI